MCRSMASVFILSMMRETCHHVSIISNVQTYVSSYVCIRCGFWSNLGVMVYDLIMIRVCPVPCNRSMKSFWTCEMQCTHFAILTLLSKITKMCMTANVVYLYVLVLSDWNVDSLFPDLFFK